MPKILICDQHESMQRSHQKELQDEGYDVLMTYSLCDALRIFRLESPALILFSIERLGAELLGTVEQMLSINRRIPIIFAGSVADEPDTETAGLSFISLERRSTFAALKDAIRDLCPVSTTSVIMETHPKNTLFVGHTSEVMQIAGMIA